MSDKNDGGQAFPCAETQYSESYPGMSIRDYFAGQALAGMTSACDSEGTWTGNVLEAAEIAYILADAMLKERDK